MSTPKPRSGAPASTAANQPGSKHLILGGATALAACVAWMAAVHPMEVKLADSRAELRDVNSRLNEFRHLSEIEPPLQGAIEDLSIQAAKTNAWTARSGDPTKLYDAIHALAESQSVRIERVEPGSARGPKPDAAAGALSTEVFSYTIEVAGAFPGVCRFIDACERDLGASKVVSFHIAPQTTGPGIKDPPITAIIETQHLKLIIPNAELPGASPVDQGARSGS